MKKQNLIISGVVGVIVVILSVFLIIKLTGNKSESDANKFKNEYEVLNGEKNSSDKEYKKLSIEENNPIKYATYDELLDLIENKTGIIYLGFPECPWCRSSLPVLLEAAKDNKIDTIYYMNMKNERDSYIVKDGKITYAIDQDGKEIKGTKGYFKLLDALDEHLDEYVITSNDKEYEVGEKRIFAPSIIFVREGEVLNIQVSTVDGHIDPYEPLTKKQYQELYNIYNDSINDIYSSTCSTDTAC